MGMFSIKSIHFFHLSYYVKKGEDGWSYSTENS